MGKEAENLTHALKGDSKTQGNWGEIQIENILQKVGLQEGLGYVKEENLKNVKNMFIFFTHWQVLTRYILIQHLKIMT